jgi:hypothetical protein
MLRNACFVWTWIFWLAWSKMTKYYVNERSSRPFYKWTSMYNQSSTSYNVIISFARIMMEQQTWIFKFWQCVAYRFDPNNILGANGILIK